MSAAVRPRPILPLPDRQYDKRTKIELARDEFAAGRITFAELEYHVEEAIRHGE